MVRANQGSANQAGPVTPTSASPSFTRPYPGENRNFQAIDATTGAIMSGSASTSRIALRPRVSRCRTSAIGMPTASSTTSVVTT